MKDAFVPTSRPALGVFAVVSFVGVALAPDGLTAHVAAQMPPSIELTATIRDFKARNQPGGHPDFERNNAIGAGGLTAGAARPWLDWDRKPIFTGGGGTPLAKPGGNYQQWKDSAGRPICWTQYDLALGDVAGTLDPTRPNPFTTAANFYEWYHDVAGVNLSTTVTLTLPLQVDGTYVFDDKNDPFYSS